MTAPSETAVEAVARAVAAAGAGSGTALSRDGRGAPTPTAPGADPYRTRVGAPPDPLVASARRWPANPILEHDPWGAVPRVNVSVKPTALSPLFAPLTAAEG